MRLLAIFSFSLVFPAVLVVGENASFSDYEAAVKLDFLNKHFMGCENAWLIRQPLFTHFNITWDNKSIEAYTYYDDKDE